MAKRKKNKSKNEIHVLVRTADSTKTFSEGDTTKWSYKSNKTTELINDTTLSYRIHNLPERYNEA